MIKTFLVFQHSKNIKAAVTTGFFVFLSLSTSSTVAYAGEYLLVKGIGIEVCRVYKKNLNSFEQTPYIYPMRCERKINSLYPDLKKPKWEKLDSLKNVDLIIDTVEFLDSELKPRNQKGYIDHIKYRIERGRVNLVIASVDINNDGKNERVLKLEDGSCELEAGNWAVPILVLDNYKNKLDIKRTLPLLQNLHRSRKNIAGSWSYAMYDVFYFKNHTYFDRWSDSINDRNKLKVYQYTGNTVKEVCRYKYRAN